MALVIQHPSIAQAQTKQSKTGVGDSTVIQEIEYNSQGLQLTVTLKNGSQYSYYGIYPQVYEEFMQSKSKGRYFSQNIKGKYQSARPISKNTGPSAKWKKK